MTQTLLGPAGVAEGRPSPLLAIAALFLFLPLVYLAVASAEAGFQSAFTRWASYAMPWSLAAATGVWAAARGRPAHQALGIALMAVPLWDTLWGVTGSIAPLVQGGFVFRPYTRYQLSSLYSYKFLADLGYLGVGFLLYSSPRLADVLRRSPRRIAAALAAAGLPMGRLGRPAEARSILYGLALFPPLLIVTLIVNSFLSGVEDLNQSDETSIFANMTAEHALLISLAAGFGEELLYRGLLQGWLSRRMPVVAAIALQAVVFGFAHSGYGTWSHVLLPTLFALFAGAAAYLFGLWAVIALHVLVDVFAFGAAATANVPWMAAVLNLGFLANLALSLTVGALAVLWFVQALEARRIAPRL